MIDLDNDNYDDNGGLLSLLRFSVLCSSNSTSKLQSSHGSTSRRRLRAPSGVADLYPRASSKRSFRSGTFVYGDVPMACYNLCMLYLYTTLARSYTFLQQLPVVVERVNRVLDGVVDVEVEWKGADLHGRVGEHIVQCKVTRLASALSPGSLEPQAIFTDDGGRDVTTQCFHVPFSILDTNECTLPRGHAMRHACHESSLCVNTIGSYECLCPAANKGESPSGTVNESFWQALAGQERGPWDLSFQLASRSSCPAKASTHGCCPERVHTPDGEMCHAAFRCPVDPCESNSTNDCSSSASCARKESPLDTPNYECQCPTGLMGNGLKCRKGVDPVPEPKVMFDGVTPTELTVKNNYYCDCTKPVVDACSGFPPCKSKLSLYAC